MAGTVLVTGATGFVGRSLVPALVSRGDRVRVANRSGAAMFPAPVEVAAIGDLSGETVWDPVLAGVDRVVHLAGIAHASGVASDLYDAVNHRATAALAQAAARAGVQRFVFVSSVLAQSGPSAPAILTEEDPPVPVSPYGASKLAAERALSACRLDHVTLRPVLVYGRGVKGNMAQLVQLARLPMPLPLGAVRNRRSLVAVEDLVAAIVVSLQAPRAVGGIFLVADDTPLSLPAMIAALRSGLGRKPGLVSLPPDALHGLARVAGLGNLWERAAGSLSVSNRKLRGLGWAPQVATAVGLASLAAHDRTPRREV